jgi:hypothetical protein
VIDPPLLGNFIAAIAVNGSRLYSRGAIAGTVSLCLDRKTPGQVHQNSRLSRKMLALIAPNRFKAAQSSK